MGYMDSLGPRIEVIPCSVEEVSKIEQEVAASEAASGSSTVEQELRHCLQKDGITFDMDSASFDAVGRRRVSKVAAILSRHPEMSFRIVGYAEAGASADLALRRSSMVRQALIDAGCLCNLLVDSAAVELPSASGKDDFPHRQVRCEVEVAAEASPNLPLLPNAPRRTLEVVFESPSGLKRVTFNRKPLGLSYQNVVPLVVTKVHPRGQAEEHCVKAGWEFRMICSRHVSSLDFSEIQEILIPAVAQLPLALSSSSYSSPEKPMSKLPWNGTVIADSEPPPLTEVCLTDASFPVPPAVQSLRENTAERVSPVCSAGLSAVPSVAPEALRREETPSTNSNTLKEESTRFEEI